MLRQHCIHSICTECATVLVSVGSGSVSAGFWPPETFPCSAGFLSWPPPAPAETSGPGLEKKT